MAARGVAPLTFTVGCADDKAARLPTIFPFALLGCLAILVTSVLEFVHLLHELCSEQLQFVAVQHVACQICAAYWRERLEDSFSPRVLLPESFVATSLVASLCVP